jgi:hypothetical protein
MPSKKKSRKNLFDLWDSLFVESEKYGFFLLRKNLSQCTEMTNYFGKYLISTFFFLTLSMMLFDELFH